MKLKIKTEKIGEFLREIVIIVIGITITLAANNWITNRSTEKDTALYLEAIRLELKENKRALEKFDNNEIQTAINYSRYLRAHNKKEMNLDSLVFYRERTTFNTTSVMIKSNAFDMFKISGNMRLVKNKEMLLSLWDSYAKLTELKQTFEGVQQMKMEDIRKFTYLNTLPDEELLKNPPMYDFYVNMAVPHVQRNVSGIVLKVLDETLSMMEHN